MTEHQSEPLPSSSSPRKNFFEMNLAELTASAQLAVDRAITEMHEQGIGSVIRKDGKLYTEYPDGHLEEIVSPLSKLEEP